MTHAKDRTRWCVLRCAGRRTLGLAESLRVEGFEAWAPIDVQRFRVPRMNARRVVKAPLVPGLVFSVSAPETETEAALIALSHNPGRLAKFTILRRSFGAIAYLDDTELEPLRKAEHMVEPKRWTSAFAKGEQVRITKGISRGLSGIVEHCNGKDADIWVCLFGRYHRLKISTFHLETDAVNRLQAATQMAA